MKKLIILLPLFVLITVSVAYGAVTMVRDLRMPDGNMQNIYSSVLDENNAKIVKFVDGETTCYIVKSVKYPEAIGTISCVK